VRWRAAVGAGYSGPAVAGGKVYLTDRILDPGASNPASPFKTDAVAGRERVLCLDQKTGKLLWSHDYPCPYRVSYAAGPRTTPIVRDGKVYSLGTMGDLFCLDANSGAVIWSKNFAKDLHAAVPFWGFAAHPLIDGDKIICLVGAPGALVVAFQKDTGNEIWRALTAREPGYCPPVIYQFAGKRQLIIWHPEAVNALDPENGRLYWSHPFKVKAGMTIAMPRQLGDRLLVSCFYNGSVLLKIDESGNHAVVVWRGKSSRELPKQTDGLHSVMATPFIKDGYIYGVCSYGELRCLKADSGERIWQTNEVTTGGPEQRWANAFIVAQGDRYFLFNELGDLIIARLNPVGCQVLARAHIIDPTNLMVASERDSGAVVWSHPAYADRAIYARNDKELVCVDLEEASRNASE
jgi:outer membrane protein assembly factor BamB